MSDNSEKTEVRKPKGFVYRQKDRFGDVETKLNWPAILKLAIPLVVLLIVLLIGWPAKVVGSTERGILYTFGKANESVLGPGLHFHAPFAQTIGTFSIVPTKMAVDINIDNSGAISKDNQIIGTRIVVYYRYDENRIYEIATQYRERSTIENPLASSVNATMKAIIGGYTIFDLAANQETMSTTLQQRLTAAIQRYPIEITQVNVSNFDWNESFDKQINATMEAAQRVRQAEQQANIAEQENRRLAIEAEAKAKALIAEAEGKQKAAELDAQARIARAEGERQAKIAEGEGISRYNQLIAQNLNTEIRIRELEIELERAKRWDGRQVPTYVPLSPSGGIVTLPVK